MLDRSINKLRIVPVILCGGSGTRLWPLSRKGFPKQFLSLTGNESLFQQAALRLMAIATDDIDVVNPLIVTGEEYRFLVSDQLRDAGIEIGTALLEPVGRNTAPALTMAAMAAQDNGEDPVLVVAPADQMIGNIPAFILAIQEAVREANKGNIVILGITPDRPSTGYGYIQVQSKNTNVALSVERFVEKPNATTAQQYLNEGTFYWNAGIFVLKASVWAKALDSFRPDIANATAAAWNVKTQDNNFVRPGKAEFSVIPSESIDYAVMECCPGSEFPIKMVRLDANWSDLGAWDTLWDILPKNEQGNLNYGDVLTTDSFNNLVYASSRLVSLVGINNLIIIETSDALLIADKSRCQDVKHIVTQLQSKKRKEYTLHRKVYRPWGWYDIIDECDRFKVKRIMVKPYASLSLQKHCHRAEHWIVVKGTAEILNGDKALLLTENQSTFIPIGVHHRLTNPDKIPLEIIEVQSGNYLGEDDIIRFEDLYGRKNS